ncbi:LysR family transcriptional regulator [Asaia prunellae]|uniref:LysR family transcriptional regulator n=1 Tax=Asaia prunellae TaxID=610245 RepID=UPI000472B1AA|nr:LysR family transcriptional regulator [Asaia prunellae]
MIELRLLRTFLAVANEGNISKAASLLGMAQPPVTRQIAALETALGARLFERLPRGVRLTDAGMAMAKEAQTLLDHHDAMLDKVARTSRGELGHLAVGFTPSAISHSMVAPMLRAFQQTWPGAELTFRENNTSPLLSEVATGRLDVAFVRTPGELPLGVKTELLFDEPMIVAFPRDHVLATTSADQAVSLAMLKDADFVMYRNPHNPGFHARVLEACRVEGYEPREAHVVPQMISALNLIEAGMGLSVFPASMARFTSDQSAIRPLAPIHGLTAPLLIAFTRLPMGQCKKNFITLARNLIRQAPGSHYPVL